MHKGIFILINLFLCLKIEAVSTLITSIPKAGTFMLMKTVGMISGIPFSYENCNDIAQQMYKPHLDVLKQCVLSNNFCCFHLPFYAEYAELFRLNNVRVCFVYRDPRDQLVSQAYYMLLQTDRIQRDHGRFDFDSLLTALIGDDEKSPREFEHFQDIPVDTLSSMEYIYHIKRYYEIFLGWQKCEVCYTTRFEDLVGPIGGGTFEKQKQEVANIANHIGFNLNDEQVANIASNIFGQTQTFREGKSGSWRTHFKEEHKKAFKAVAGDLLVRLGYETVETNETW